MQFCSGRPSPMPGRGGRQTRGQTLIRVAAIRVVCAEQTDSRQLACDLGGMRVRADPLEAVQQPSHGRLAEGGLDGNPVGGPGIEGVALMRAAEDYGGGVGVWVPGRVLLELGSMLVQAASPGRVGEGHQAARRLGVARGGGPETLQREGLGAMATAVLLLVVGQLVCASAGRLPRPEVGVAGKGAGGYG